MTYRSLHGRVAARSYILWHGEEGFQEEEQQEEKVACRKQRLWEGNESANGAIDETRRLEGPSARD